MKHPMQPIYLDGDGVARFRANPIVRFLLDAGPFDLNTISALPGISKDDYAQFMQLIGYSVSSFGDLDCADPETVRVADDAVEKLLRDSKYDAAYLPMRRF